jgi:hypothetical protein
LMTLLQHLLLLFVDPALMDDHSQETAQ